MNLSAAFSSSLQDRVAHTTGAVGMLVSVLGYFTRTMVCVLFQLPLICQVLHYALVSFVLLDVGRSHTAYASVYYLLHVVVLLVPVLAGLLPRKRSKDSKQE